ncbi:MAG: alpha-2-macroglobulin family protein, partial [Planctomycetota bacterium]
FESEIEDSEYEDYYWTTSFDVQSYRKPEFQAVVEEVSTTSATIRAEYLFGSPVRGSVEWEIRQVPIASEISRNPWQPRPPNDDPRAWLFGYESPKESYGWNSIGTGGGALDDNGKLSIQLPKPVATLDRSRYEITATVVDDLGYSVDLSEPLPYRQAIDVRIAPEKQYFILGDELEASVRVRDAVGKALPSTQVDVTLFLAPSPFDRSEAIAVGADERLTFEELGRLKIQTDEKGVAKIRQRSDRAGILLLRADVQGDQETSVRDQAEIWIVDPERQFSALELRERDTRSVAILTDRTVYNIGDTARVAIRTNLPQSAAYLRVESLGIPMQKRIHLKNEWTIVDLEITEAMAPNPYVCVEFVEAGDIEASCFEFFVYPEGRFFDVEVQTDREQYAPGDEATVTLTAKGLDSEAEFEIAIVDEAIFALAQDATPDIRSAFLIERREESDLIDTADRFEGVFALTTEQKNRWYWKEQASSPPPQLAISFTDDGDFEDDALDSGAHPQPTVRRYFPDTLHWSAHVKTDASGRAVTKVKVPDSLTKWRVVARAISGKNRFGVGTSSMLTRKDVVFRLNTPRFFTENDVCTIATTVYNHSEKHGEFQLTLEAEDATKPKALAPTTVRIAARGQARVHWQVQVPSTDSLVLLGRTTSEVGGDAIELTIPVRRLGVASQSFASGTVKTSWKTDVTLPVGAKRSSAELEVMLHPSARSAVFDALPFLAGYPYGCVEQTMSRFLPALVASRAAGDDALVPQRLRTELPHMVEHGLRRLLSFQHDDGGWGWWKHDETDHFMTAYVIYGLTLARERGFAVPTEALQRAAEWLADNTQSTAYQLFALHRDGEDVAEFVDECVPRNDLDRALLVLAGRQEFLSELEKVNVQEKGARNIRLGAWALRALIHARPKSSHVERLAEELLAARVGPAWISTLDSAEAVLALSSLPEGPTDLRGTLTVNGHRLGERAGRVLVDPQLIREGKNTVEVSTNGAGRLHVSARLRYQTENPKSLKSDALKIKRRFDRRVRKGKKFAWTRVKAGDELTVGDVVRVKVTVRARRTASRVLVESPLSPCGEYLSTDLDKYEASSDFEGYDEDY